VFSGSNVLWAIATALSEIKGADDLTDADMGALLGKSPDQARAYRRGEAMMDAETFGRGKREWNGRFTGYYDRLCEDSRPGNVCDRATLSVILECAARLSKALEDGEIAVEEVLEHRSQIEEARDQLNLQLAKLGPADLEGVA
jgi:hypothetical protein